MEEKTVIYGPVYGKVEDVQTGVVNGFKAFDGFIADISETPEGTRVNIFMDSGEEFAGKSKHTGRLGLKIAYTKALRKFLKAEIEQLENDAECDCDCDCHALGALVLP